MNTRKIIVHLLLVISTPIAVFLIIYNIYFFQSSKEKYREIGLQLSDVLQENLDEKLSSIRYYLINESGSGDFSTICFSGDDALNRNISLTNIVERFTQKIQDISEIAALIITSDDFFRERYHPALNFSDTLAIKNYVKASLDQSISSRDWGSSQIDGHPYLSYVVVKNNVSLNCILDLERLYNNYYSDYYRDYLCIITDKSGRVVFRSSYQIPGDNQTFEDEIFLPASYEGRYVCVSSDHIKSSYTVYCLAKHMGLFYDASLIEICLFAFSSIFILLIPFCFLYINKCYLTPLKQLTQDILEMQAAVSNSRNYQMELPIRHYEINEFKIFQNALRDLFKKNHQLTTEYYQKKMESQKISLQCYHLQIKPHFYLNCLKQIYSLLRQQQYAEAENALFFLAGYLRFILKDQVSFTSLTSEMECVSNYVRLRNIGAKYPIIYTNTVDPEIKDTMIPMLLLLIFVENSVKYATPPDSSLMIQIEARLLSDSEYPQIYFCIRDNGSGYDNKVLFRYNTLIQNDFDEEVSENTEYGIGIENILRRTHILYEGNEIFHFSNDSGAMIEIILPLRMNRGSYECDDC